MSYETLRYGVARPAWRRSRSTSPTRATRCPTSCSTSCSRRSSAARDDDAVRCVVLTSTHDRVFSSGANLGGFAGRRAAGPQALRRPSASRACSELLGELGKPSICAANGHVLAGALGLALACDLIVASDEARFGTPEINVGVFPFMIMALIYRNVGRKKTAELMLLGEQISAAEAERIGIVNRVVPADELDARSTSGRASSPPSRRR